MCYLFRIFMQRLLNISHHIMLGDRNEYSNQNYVKIARNRNEIVMIAIKRMEWEQVRHWLYYYYHLNDSLPLNFLSKNVFTIIIYKIAGIILKSIQYIRAVIRHMKNAEVSFMHCRRVVISSIRTENGSDGTDMLCFWYFSSISILPEPFSVRIDKFSMSLHSPYWNTKIISLILLANNTKI